jgi:hypothetical protein
LINKQWRTFGVGIGAALMDEAALSSLAADANRRFPVRRISIMNRPVARVAALCSAAAGQKDRIMGW